MRFQNTLVVAFAALLSFRDAGAATCLMLYMVADNSLETQLSENYSELAQSLLVTDIQIRTWVYYDAFNGQALPNTLDTSFVATGNAETRPFTGSYYITYDQEYGSMISDVELAGEQNSDTQGQIEDFVVHALDNCLADGYDSLMLVFSGMGGGFAGFGGDENARKLLNTNANIAGAIRNALDVAGGPEKLEVIGFEGNSMQALGSADDYTGVAQYMLASEAIMPGHGFAYSNLTPASSAMTLSVDIIDSYLSQTQEGDSHATPKTLSLVDLASFETFVADWETLFATISSQLAGNDSSLYAFLARTRASAVSFVGIIDAVGSRIPFEPSALDIGSFLTMFKASCSPDDVLQTALDNAIISYENMFVAGGNGKGTPPGSGMTCTWPNQAEYNENPALWDQVLFQNSNYVTESTPNFRAFLQEFLLSSPPGTGDGVSVCTKSAEPTEGQSSDVLIIDDSFVASNDTGALQVQMEATISPDVSQVLVEYALDVSRSYGARLESMGFSSSPDDYLYLLGGDVPAAYENDRVSANWNATFYNLGVSSISETDNLTVLLYVFDDGDGAKRSPCMYFPEERGDDLLAMNFSDYVFFDFDYWVGQGAQFCNLFFSDNAYDNVALYVSNSAGVWVEQAKEADGYLVPLLYVDGFVQNTRVNTFPGGLGTSWIRWRPTSDFTVIPWSVTEIFETGTWADAIQLNVLAVNHGDPFLAPEDFRYYDVLRRSACLDTAEWVDADGDTCSWYEIDDRCRIFGNSNAGPDNTTARESCCVCWGGDSTIVAPSDPDCSDIPGWVDFGLDDCFWYSSEAGRCELWGDTEGFEGITPNEACCVCGGGDPAGGTETTEPSKKRYNWFPGGFGP